ncbi:MAG: DsrE family protein [Pseudomonadota bacterium]
MKNLRHSALMVALLTGLMLVQPALPANAGDQDPLFINLTTNDDHRLTMALTFSSGQMQRGHPVTLFLNDKAVLAASTANGDTFAAQQEKLMGMIEAGATVLVCPGCMKHYEVTEADLLPGMILGNPERTGQAVFAEGTQTLTW